MVALIVLVGPGTSAQAAFIHVFDSGFNSGGTLTDPDAVAVDESTGAVYVRNAATVQKFDAEGNPENFSALGTNTLSLSCPNSSTGCDQLSVDNSGGPNQGVIYVGWRNSSTAGPPRDQPIQVYLPTGEFAGDIDTFEQNFGGCFCDAVVDSTGDVYVLHDRGDQNQGGSTLAYVERFSPAMWEAGVDQAPAPLETLYALDRYTARLAIDSARTIYATNGVGGPGGASSGPLDKWSSSLFEIVPGGPPSGNVDSSGSLNVDVDPETDEVYSVHGDEIVRFNSAGGQLETFGGGGELQNATDAAINGETGAVYVTDANLEQVSIYVHAEVPLVETSGASGVTRNEAILAGHLDPDGAGEVTGCAFEYVTDAEFQGSGFSGAAEAPCEPAPPFVAPEDVAAEITGLEAETLYHFRLAAANANGTNRAPALTLETEGAVLGLTTDGPTELTRTGATLNGSYEGEGEETTYYFKWGETASYGEETPLENAGTPVGPTALSAELSGLDFDTTYHYRVVATNGAGTTEGDDETFSTLPAVLGLTTDAVTNLLPTGTTLNASYEGDGDDTIYYFEYGPNTFYGLSTPVQSTGAVSGPQTLEGPVSGLDLETTYHYRVVAENTVGITKGEDEEFTTPPAVAGVNTTEATVISQDGVTLNGEFEGNGEQTSYYFEYGPTTEYGLVSKEAPGSDAGSPVGPTPVSHQIGEFGGYTTYHYRLVASNSYGTTNGPDETFETLPAPLPGVSGTTASDVDPTSAMLSAQVNPNRWPTVYLFEWGPSTAYGTSTLLNDVIGGLDNGNHSVSTEATGLIPATAYHFRVVAINLTGTTNGPDQTFVTPDAPRIESTFSSAVGQSFAHLGARVAGNTRRTGVQFEYGTSTAYGAATAPVSLNSPDLLAREIGADVGGLTPGATYHFRAVATNSIGVSYGPDQVLTTAPAAERGPPSRDCRKLARRAKRRSNRAKQLRSKASKSSSSRRSRALRKRAAGSARRAKRLSKRAKACRRGNS